MRLSIIGLSEIPIKNQEIFTADIAPTAIKFVWEMVPDVLDNGPLPGQFSEQDPQAKLFWKLTGQ